MHQSLLHYCFIGILLINGFWEATAQTGFEAQLRNTGVAAGVATGNGGVLPSLSFAHYHNLGERKRFQLGYGLRYNGLFRPSAEYTTAPTKLIKENKIDTLFVSDVSTHSLNLAIFANYWLSDKLHLSFSLDVLGLSFGAETDAIFNGASQTARPTPLNVLLVNTNDIGSLNSEFSVSYLLSEKWGLRGGLSYMFSEYTTTQKLAHNNDRFRYKNIAGFVSILYYPFQ